MISPKLSANLYSRPPSLLFAVGAALNNMLKMKKKLIKGGQGLRFQQTD
jgi:hypothetical protein